MENKIFVSPKLELKLLPSQILFLEILNFPTYSLIEFLKKESEENPFLHFDYNEEEINKVYQETTFEEKLIEELYLLNIPENLLQICEFIIMNLEDNGYFKMELKDVSKMLNVSEQEVEKSLKIVQSLEPTGIGARNLQECLLLQIKKFFKDDKNLITIVQDCWDLLVKKKYKKIAQKLKINETSINELIEKIKKLRPFPVRNSKKPISRRIIPEGRILEDGDMFKVVIEDKISPFIKIEVDYEKFLSSPFISQKEKKFLLKKIKRVKMIIEMIEKRKKFLEDLFNKIVNYQKEFFKNGNLLPLRLKDIAKTLNVSVSTISRAVNGKYLIYSKGLLKIRDLFISEFKYSLSKTFIMRNIKKIIENEDKPLSDRKIAEKLGYFGIKISPRTVNKYRNQMKILNSYLR
ncbi:MAG: RNA polymerase factor sigma-54 [Candidatus Omnitrophica bacterium]|nr:RNA polymerase factor sigma-54 [Candidatus Omnitrophota bacterium]MCM8803221.1 RNA polymerase factor sigma-54 [Candidatus Omnitrophota bacterium]